MRNNRLILAMQISGGLVLGAMLALIVLKLISARQASQAWMVTLPTILLLLMVGVGIGLTLLGLAALLNQSARSVEQTPGHASTSNELGQINETLLELRDEFNLLRSTLAVDQARREEDEEDQGAHAGGIAATPFAPGHPSANMAIAPQLTQLLQELRDIALMDETQRRELAEKHQYDQKIDLLKRAQTQIHQGNWSQAQHLLEKASVDHQNDSEVEQVRQELRIAQANAELTALDQSQQRIGDLIALAHWDQAMQLAQQVAADYPDNAEAAEQSRRLAKEYTLWHSATAEQVYQETKNHINHRNWRQARQHADRLLEQFASHHRAATIREQIDLIRDNAEVEERQEQESRIQELIKSNHLSQAIELAEHLIEVYPDSVQATGLREMLPRLRQRAFRDIAES